MKYMMLILFLGVSFAIIAQPSEWKNSKYFTIMSYNVENLFDTLALDKADEFTPESAKNWNTEKYNQKLKNIAQVIASVHSEELPELVGLIEIENIQVLHDLVETPLLKKGNYIPLLIDGPDPRGIDCGIIYRPDVFKYLTHKAVPIIFKETDNKRTRDILYMKGLVNKDTIHVFVNHWSSRRNGQDDTESKRIQCADVLKKQVDSILRFNSQNKIVCLGDFNDEPSDNSLKKALDAGQPQDPSLLINTMYPLHLKGLGTYYFNKKYNMLDNLIVSRSAYTNKKGFRLYGETGFIHAPDFLNYTQKNGDKSPSKSYGGDKYFGGYSDHYPIYGIFYEK